MTSGNRDFQPSILPHVLFFIHSNCISAGNGGVLAEGEEERQVEDLRWMWHLMNQIFSRTLI